MTHVRDVGNNNWLVINAREGALVSGREGALMRESERV